MVIRRGESSVIAATTAFKAGVVVAFSSWGIIPF
jgi:hypothetical protein